MSTTPQPPGPAVARTPRGSECVTHAVRVRVWPTYLPDQSDPLASRWVYGYRIRITNENERHIVQLLRRRWEIVDADGRHRSVEGEGVVGQTPILKPGQMFEYSSYCPLDTPWGTMEGSFTFLWIQASGDTIADRNAADTRDVSVARFFLVPTTGSATE